MRRFSIGCIGARTTAFKTVRFDEIALQKHGITVETFDLSDLFGRVGKLSASDARVKDRIARLAGYTNCSKVPALKMESLAKVGVVIDDYIAEYGLGPSPSAAGRKCNASSASRPACSSAS